MEITKTPAVPSSNRAIHPLGKVPALKIGRHHPVRVIGGADYIDMELVPPCSHHSRTR